MKSDQSLTALARSLKSLEFVHPLTPDEKATARRRWLGDKRACSHFFTEACSVWSIKICLNSRTRVLALLPGGPEQAEKALRFADMAMMYFWRYKLRRCAEPTDRQLNFSAARAKADLDNEPEMRRLLEAEEHCLVENAGLKLPSLVPEGPTRSKIQNDIAELRKDIAAGIAALNSRIGVLTQVAPIGATNIADTLNQILARLTALEFKTAPQYTTAPGCYPMPVTTPYNPNVPYYGTTWGFCGQAPNTYYAGLPDASDDHSLTQLEKSVGQTGPPGGELGTLKI